MPLNFNWFATAVQSLPNKLTTGAGLAVAVSAVFASFAVSAASDTFIVSAVSTVSAIFETAGKGRFISLSCLGPVIFGMSSGMKASSRISV
ncbi:MAG: hypothetical protein ABI659_05040, partial [Nitrosospira sp.]